MVVGLSIFPILEGYYTHITFNDGAMIGVMELLQGIAQKKTILCLC